MRTVKRELAAVVKARDVGSLAATTIRRLVLLVGWSCGLISASAQDDADLDRLRREYDRQLATELQRLAAKCDSLGLAEQAARTRSWWIDRDPERQYLFLPADSDRDEPQADDAEVIRFWHKHFRAIRDGHADKLYRLGEQFVAQRRPARAYHLFHEVLHHAPDHAGARSVLGYRKHLGRWRRGSTMFSSRVARVVHPLFGWAPRRYWRTETAHFEITTNHSVREAKELGQQLELLHDVWRQAFYRFWAAPGRLAAALDGERPGRASVKKHKVVLFRDREDYLAGLQRYIPNIEVSTGLYSDQRQTSYFYVGDESVLATHFHETTHQLFFELGPGLADVGLRDNNWVVEAIAMYMESLVRHEGYVTLGGFDAPRMQFARLRALNLKFYVPLAELSAMGREAMQQDERLRGLYSQSAGLAHFLMDHDAGHYREAMVDYLVMVYAGRQRRDTLEKLLGASLAEVDEQYRRFLDVSDEQLARFLRPTESLTKLCLGHTSITDKSLVLLADARKLDWLDVSYTGVTDAAAHSLGGLSSLTQLSLAGTETTDSALQVVGQLRTLQLLDLSRTRITDAGLEHLAGLTNLTHLFLRGTEVSDDGLQQLTRLKRLQFLDTGDTSVTLAGRNQLRKSLPALND